MNNSNNKNNVLSEAKFSVIKTGDKIKISVKFPQNFDIGSIKYVKLLGETNKKRKTVDIVDNDCVTKKQKSNTKKPENNNKVINYSEKHILVDQNNSSINCKLCKQLCDTGDGVFCCSGLAINDHSETYDIFYCYDCIDTGDKDLEKCSECGELGVACKPYWVCDNENCDVNICPDCIDNNPQIIDTRPCKNCKIDFCGYCADFYTCTKCDEYYCKEDCLNEICQLINKYDNEYECEDCGNLITKYDF